jgi:hypothetical protein
MYGTFCSFQSLPLLAIGNRWLKNCQIIGISFNLFSQNCMLIVVCDEDLSLNHEFFNLNKFEFFSRRIVKQFKRILHCPSFICDSRSQSLRNISTPISHHKIETISNSNTSNFLFASPSTSDTLGRKKIAKASKFYFTH